MAYNKTTNDKVFDLITENDWDSNWGAREEEGFQAWGDEQPEHSAYLINKWLNRNVFDTRRGSIEKAPGDIRRETQEGYTGWEPLYMEHKKDIDPYLREEYYNIFVKDVMFPKMGI